MNKEELKVLIDNMHLVADNVPRGLSHLNDALTFALLDLAAYYGQRIRMKAFDKALAFGQSIPTFTDFESEEFTNWLLHDKEYLKYWPPY